MAPCDGRLEEHVTIEDEYPFPRPTVGRQAHYYADRTSWTYAASDEVMAKDFRGPYAATIVYVHDGGRVNLLICFPGPCSDRTTELVDDVGFHSTPKNGCWTWPPRV